MPIGVRGGLFADVAPRYRDTQRHACFARATRSAMKPRQNISTLGALRLADIERDAARRTSELIRERAVTPANSFDERAQKLNEFD